MPTRVHAFASQPLRPSGRGSGGLAPALALGRIVILSLLLAWLPATHAAGEGDRAEATAVPRRTAAGFAVPQPGRIFAFPRDHGSHPDFKIEWWYITGHLQTESGREFGFQATWFRSAAPPIADAKVAARDSDAFSTRQLYMAHMALVDLQTGEFRYQERLNREGWDAQAAVDHLHVRNGNWSLQGNPPPLEGEVWDPAMRLRAGIQATVGFDFTLTPTRPLTVFGADGVSRKGADPTAASHYLTFTRLALSGSLTLDGKALAVTGLAWMDHEISSSQLDEEQVGWNWASLHLDDGRDLMVYVLRHKDGTPDPYSSLTWVAADGTQTRQTPTDFTLRPHRQWTSPHTGAVYPIGMDITARDPATGKPRRLRLEPVVDDQELAGKLGRVAYWEGACRVLDEDGTAIGKAYMELTGYAASLKNRF